LQNKLKKLSLLKRDEIIFPKEKLSEGVLKHRKKRTPPSSKGGIK
jgi:hypothetical protein